MRIVLLMASLLAGQMLGSWDADAKAKAQALASGIEKCSPRVAVANFGKLSVVVVGVRRCGVKSSSDNCRLCEAVTR